MKRGPVKPRKGADPAYLEQVRGLPCAVQREVVPFPYECSGRIHAHHAGRRPGVGLKAKDDTAIPLCAWHHRMWHDMDGYFCEMTKADRRRWSDAAIDDTRRLLGAPATREG